MIRVLHSVSNMDRGGIETMLMNYYRHIDRSKVQFDFIVNKKKPGDYDDEIRRLGGHIYQSPGLDPLHYPAYLRFVQQTVAADPRIRILHAHNEAMGLYALKGAEKAGLQVRIAHAHNIWIVRDYKWPLKMLCKRLLPGAATHLWACGRDAGIYYFGKADWERRGQIIPNAIEPETFRFTPAVRAEMRARYGLENRVVLGPVGRFDVRKNHERLLEIFAAFLQLEPRAVLVLIGVLTVLHAGVNAVAKLFDDTAQKQEYEDKLEGLVLFDPVPFEGIENIDDLTLREAAVWGCVYSIQETQGGFDGYNTDPDTEQLLIPSVDVDAYLAKLVGPSFRMTHKTFEMEDMTIEFDDTTQCYKIPVTGLSLIHI